MVVNRRRVKTIDMHAHCVIPEALLLMQLPLPQRRGLALVVEDRLREMDDQGIDVKRSASTHSGTALSVTWRGK